MKLQNFIAEAIRSADLRPRKATDTSTPEGETQEKIRKAGDVGKREMLQKVTGKEVRNARDFRRLGRPVATKAAGITFGDEQDPIDRALDITRGPAAYQAGEEEKRKEAYRAAKPKDKKNMDMTPGIEPGEYEKLPAAKKMAIAVPAGRQAGRLSAQGEVEDALDIASYVSAEPEAREPIKIKSDKGEIEVADSPQSRHKFQRSGIDVGDPEEDPDYEGGERDPRQLVDADIDTIVAGMMDPEKAGLTMDVDAVQSKGGRDVQHTQTPSKKDLETIFRGQQEWTDALQREDSKAIQDMSFKYDIDDETLNKFISRLGTTGQGNEKAIQKFKMSGLAPGRMRAAYGGDLGEEGKKYQIEGAPDGVYDMDKMKKMNKTLFEKALNNRGREALRTYLRQGGIDSYAQHEGQRSIGDMDLEHIRALKSQQPDGNGWDHPDNWVWASAPLNRLRGNTPLPQATQKFDTGPEVRSYDKEEVLKSYNDHIASVLGERPKGQMGKEWDALRAQIDDDLGGRPSEKGGRGAFSAAQVMNRSPEEREAEIQRLIDVGYPEEFAQKIVPNPQSQFDQDARVSSVGTVGQETRTDGKPLAAGEDEYDQDFKTQLRDETMYQKGLVNIKKTIPEYANMNNSEIETNTVEGQQLMAGLRNLKTARVRDDSAMAALADTDDGDI